MNTHNIQTHDKKFSPKKKKKNQKKKKKSLDICFHELSEEFRKDSKTSLNQPW